MGTLRTAVITNSRAEAKALRMELSFLRNKLVTIPSTALLTIRISTSGLTMDVREEAVKALARSPLFRIFRIHQKYFLMSSLPWLRGEVRYKIWSRDT